MNCNKNWPFADGGQVIGMKLTEYLIWATGSRECPKELLLPSIQRGFVWKPKQIVDLWDSLLRGMPIGSLMLSKLSVGQIADTLAIKGEKATKTVSGEAMGLLDGQQRTLAMLIGWPSENETTQQHCLWIDLAEEGHAGSPFDIRLTTKAQPFGFQRISHSRLHRHERRKARESYDDYHKECHPEYLSKPDYELFGLNSEHGQPRPWKANSDPNLFIKVKDLWEAFEKTGNDESAFLDLFKLHLADASLAIKRLSCLHKAFTRLESLEVPLIMIPEHIGKPIAEDTPNGGPDPLVLLFERIGRNGASLSTEDLLFSMIKQQWPEAQELVNRIHGEISVGAFMSAMDYIMTAYRLGSTEVTEVNITDNPRPNPNDFHRHLGSLLGKKGESNKPLRDYLEKNSRLETAFKSLFSLLAYRKDSHEQDIGLPSPFMPHLPRGLVQALLYWVMINPDKQIIEENRQSIVSFCLFWYLNIWHEDKASKKAFVLIQSSAKGYFPANELYKALIESPNQDELGLALPLMSGMELEEILNKDASVSFRSHDDIFMKPDSKWRQRELYKRFCWWRKPILLWLQRTYVERVFGEQSRTDFAGLTDEDTVPYDYDHLCPQNHWGLNWQNITRSHDGQSTLLSDFQTSRHITGNCIGNLHVLDSSLNRSFGEEPLASKLKSGLELRQWHPEDSLLYHSSVPEHDKLWEVASPDNEEKKWKWSEERLLAFQNAVYGRSLALYCQYYEACKHIIPTELCD